MVRTLIPAFVMLTILATGATASSPDVHFLGHFSSYPCDAMEVGASVACLGGGNHFEVMDLGAGDTPGLLGRTEVAGPIKDIALNGHYAFLACYDKGLRIVYVGNPGVPHEVGACSGDWRAIGVAAGGSHAYIATYRDGLLIVDVSDPAAPAVVATFDVVTSARIVLEGDLLYIADGNDAVHVVDVTTPALPALVRTIGWGGEDVVVNGNTAYFTGNVREIVVADVTDPAFPSRTTVITLPENMYPERLHVDGDTLTLLAAQYPVYGLWVLSVADPENPQTLGSVALAGDRHDLYIEGERAWVANGDRGLRVIDTLDPSAMAEVGAWETGGRIRDVALDGTLAALACGNAGVRLLDLSDPTNPVQRGVLETGTAVMGVDLADGLVAAVGTGFRLIDVSDPDVPACVGLFEGLNLAFEVILRDQTAFVGRNSGLGIIDIADPGNPLYLGGFLFTPAYAFDIALHDDRIYMSGGDRGPPAVGIIDVSDLANPVDIGFVNYVPGNTVEAVGSAVVTAGWNDMRFVDASDPQNPVTTGTIARGASALVRHDFGLLSAAPTGGLDVIRGGFNRDPAVVASHPCGGNAIDLAVSGNVVALADRYDGLWILGLEWTVDAPAFAGTMLTARPNPFNPATTLEYVLDRDGHALMEVFDMRGRLIRRLVDETHAAGTHQATWRGDDAAGRAMPSGSYVVVLRTETGVTTTRLSLVK